MRPHKAGFGAVWVALVSAPAAADLTYTFVDFRVLANDLQARGTATPVTGQDVTIDTGEGDGIAVAGSVALPAGLYMTGGFGSSVVDAEVMIESPLTEVRIDDEFDLITSSIGLGYHRRLTNTMDLIVEMTREAAELDFGSLAGEDFDTEDSGVATRIGLRWSPAEPFELYAIGGRSPIADISLEQRRFEAGAVINAGARWFFFPDLGVGLDYQSGDLSVVTLSMRFGFGNLPW